MKNPWILSAALLVSSACHRQAIAAVVSACINPSKINSPGICTME